jgi:hypothetical protein
MNEVPLNEDRSQIRTQGEWARWVLQCGAKERNLAIREFGLDDQEVIDLKKTSRRMKLLFAQRRYLSSLKKRELDSGSETDSPRGSPEPSSSSGEDGSESA